MRIEHGVFVLMKEEVKRSKKKFCEFEGIIIDLIPEKEGEARIFFGYYFHETGKYYTKDFGIIYVGIKRHTVDSFKKIIINIMENCFLEKLEIGFPEIAITEELRKILI